MLQRTVDAAARWWPWCGPRCWNNRTPCSAWDTRALVNHMIGANYAFIEGLAKRIDSRARTGSHNAIWLATMLLRRTGRRPVRRSTRGARPERWKRRCCWKASGSFRAGWPSAST